MKFISESEIDLISEQLDADVDQENFFKELATQQPVLLSFLVSDNLKVLTEEEHELLYFLAAIIWKSISKAHPESLLIDENILGKAEEGNWELLEANVRGTFSERITPFFEKYPQEDLLAFIEDALVFDEESQVTNEGRVYIFVVLKTMVDAYVKVLSETRNR